MGTDAPNIQMDMLEVVSGGGAEGGAAPNLLESSDDDGVVVRRVELQEAVQELSEIIFGVELLFEDHLQHGASEVEIRVFRLFLDRHALPAQPPEALHRAEALDVRLRGGEAVVRWRLDGGGRGECGRGVEGARRGGRVAVAVPAAEEGGEGGPAV
ncbi:uncharacterized protein LOC121765853 [Salvia splendens]|uniref:uncharacterized protein LOC121765853 n=1 Tax=Salvia splendens TaxID=180675 RepID=UPI001C26235B|nr:uncharacterized protein LOC121765853 [Salvia splendens]